MRTSKTFELQSAVAVIVAHRPYGNQKPACDPRLLCPPRGKSPRRPLLNVESAVGIGANTVAHRGSTRTSSRTSEKSFPRWCRPLARRTRRRCRSLSRSDGSRPAAGRKIPRIIKPGRCMLLLFILLNHQGKRRRMRQRPTCSCHGYVIKRAGGRARDYREIRSIR